MVGWQGIFEDSLKHFVHETKDRNPLILDGCINYTSVATTELAQKENISIMKLSTHCNGVLQPLNIAYFVLQRIIMKQH